MNFKYQGVVMNISPTLIKQILFRNNYCRYGKPAIKKRVNLEYFDSVINLGDTLSPVICEWMLNKKSLSFDDKVRKTRHLMALGSILGGNGFFDAVVWGSGIKSFDQISSLGKRKYIQKLDLRLVRGPLTRDALIGCGYKCPAVYGDPAVLMPYIYMPEVKKTHSIGLILHYTQEMNFYPDVKKINIRTNNYMNFIDELCNCEKIISSSLHGIILAEAYGIPAVFLGEGRDIEMFKYYDWYLASGRRNVKIAFSLEEAIAMEPLVLPDLTMMYEEILATFPYDLWIE